MWQERAFFTPKDQRKLGRLEDQFSQADSVCFIDVHAIAHDWEPGEEITLATKSADVVTLELTRNVVTQGLAGGESQILGRNPFWKGIVDGLTEVDREQLVRGVEVNQTARVGWKRFALHTGSGLAPGLLTIEVEDTNNPQLYKLLPEEHGERLQKYNWVTVEEDEWSVRALHKSSRGFARVREGKLPKRFPIYLFPGGYLVSDAFDQYEEFEGRHPVTYMKKPDQSVIAANSDLIDAFSGIPMELSDQEKRSLAHDVMLKSVLSHAELKDAEEILYNVYQYAKQKRDVAGNMRAVHIGGADHAESIAYVLGSHIKNKDAISVSVVDDPRFRVPLLRGGTLEFLRRTIPFEDRLRGITVEGFEIYADPPVIVANALNAIFDNFEDFQKRILVERICPYNELGKTLDSYKRVVEIQSDLYDLNTEELRRLGEEKQSSPAAYTA